MTKLTYEGIKKRYPRTPLPEKIRGYFQLIRPFTLAPAIIAGIFGVSIALAYYHIFIFWESYLSITILASLSLMFTQAFGQVMNQVMDVDIDTVNKKYRPIPSGLISVDEALVTSLVFVGLALLTATFVNPLFLTFIGIGLFMGYAYNCEPLRLKKRLWVNVAGLAFSRGLLPFPMMWSAIGVGVGEPIPWLLGGFAFLWVCFGQNTKDFPDIEGDREYGMKTLPVVYGKTGALRIMQVLSLFPFLYLSFVVALEWLPVRMLVLFVLAFLAVVMVTQNDVELKKMENTTSWVCFYLGLMLIYILSLLVYM